MVINVWFPTRTSRPRSWRPSPQATPRIIEESAGELKELQNIVNPTDMSLTDKDRIDVVQRVYGVLRRHRDLARYYTRKNISISLLRAARKRDMEGVLSLYGTDEQRYW